MANTFVDRGLVYVMYTRINGRVVEVGRFDGNADGIEESQKLHDECLYKNAHLIEEAYMHGNLVHMNEKTLDENMHMYVFEMRMVQGELHANEYTFDDEPWTGWYEQGA